MTAPPVPAATNPPTEGAARALLYLRVSTKEQAHKGNGEEGFSIPTQRLLGERKATSLGATVVREFVDAGESARSADRPGLQAMLDFIRAEPVDYLIVHKIDRLARNRVDDLMITLALEQANVRLISCSEDIDNRTPSGKLTHGVMALIAEWYSSNLSSEVKTKTLEKVRQGGTPFKAPVGYRNVHITVNGQVQRTVEIDPDRARLVQWAFEAYATGDWTIRTLAVALEDLGLTTVGSRHYAEKALPLSTVNRMLRSPYYIGKVVWQGVQYDGHHPRLISPELFDKVQAVLEAHGTAGERTRIHQHYLKGTVWCGQCGSRLIVSFAKNRHGATYAYFLCIGRQQKRTDCRQRALPIELVEAAVTDHWRTVQLSADEAGTLRGAVDEALAVNREVIDREQAKATRQRQKLTEEQTKLLQAYYAGAISIELLGSEQDRIRRALQETDSKLEISSSAIDVVSENLDRCLELLSNCETTYRGADDAVRRQMNQAIFTRLYIDEGGVSGYELESPFDLLHEPELLEAQVQGEQSSSHIVAEQDLPDWLAEGSWWGIRAGAFGTDTGKSSFGQRHRGGLRNPVRGLNKAGLNKGYLVPPAGLEPALTAF